MLGVDEFVLHDLARDFVVRVQRRPSALTREQSRNAAQVVFALRFGVESNDPELTLLARQLDQALDFGASVFNPLAESFGGGPFASSLISRIQDELASGRLLVEERRQQPLGEREEDFGEPFQPPPAAKESSDTFFELRVVDEIGQAISGVSVEFSLEGEFRDVTSNAAGVALLDGVLGTSASAAVTDSGALEKALDPRWTRLRPGAPPNESNSTSVVFSGANIAPFAVKAAVPNTLIVRPELGKIHLRLVDKRNRVAHAKRDYRIDGPVALSGTTDERGELLHEGLPYADFRLTLTLDDESPEIAVVVLDSSATLQVRRLGFAPYVELAELRGLFFPTNKSFLLPATVAVFERVRAVYERNSSSELLIVGHTDTTADAATNDPLSLERAKNTLAFLRDDVDAWLAMYEPGVPELRRWGSDEDEAMVESLPDFESILPGEDRIRWYQRTRNLVVDGRAGPKTRRVLIREYMGLDGVSLEDPGFDIQATVHGAGERFPLNELQDDVDPAPTDAREDQADRRVELFFFDPDFGIQPPPPGENSKAGDKQYLEWRRAAQRHELIDLASETVLVQCVDEADQPLAGLPFRLTTATGKSFSGALDDQGLARVVVATTEPCQLFVTGIDESALARVDTPSDDATTAAALEGAGVEVLPGARAVVRVGLGELALLADVDPDELAGVSFSLQSSDGAFSQSVAADAAAQREDGSLELVFRGLPTLKTFSLSHQESDGGDTVFRDVAFADLAGLSEALRPTQVEPTAGGEDGRISSNDLGEQDDDGTRVA